ncbi:Os08g0478000 [Oryza sativa Japonica Group]|uniref:Os08g0478000 protein n=2 Tax=Oryza sativa subsp. japonica TaxID=39947 RepID=Q6ZJC6_ORYSJ|nr:hypothetical protein EE612_044912 [Oryza sativa]BAD09005.1 unknown protein [Oryza sativa Japonica Group]BAT05898.1 Os08g0478000 [Oryza sativa Japonica Group]
MASSGCHLLVLLLAFSALHANSSNHAASDTFHTCSPQADSAPNAICSYPKGYHSPNSRWHNSISSNSGHSDHHTNHSYSSCYPATNALNPNHYSIHSHHNPDDDPYHSRVPDATNPIHVLTSQNH